MSSWFNFVPHRREWGCSVWIEIDRDKVTAQIISAEDLKARQSAEDRTATSECRKSRSRTWVRCREQLLSERSSSARVTRICIRSHASCW
jgi:hypothetical protein